MTLSELEKDILKEFNIDDMVISSNIAFKFDIPINQISPILHKLFKHNFIVYKPLNEINSRHTSTSPHLTISKNGKEYLENNP